jgi:hypothetical protein
MVAGTLILHSPGLQESWSCLVPTICQTPCSCSIWLATLQIRSPEQRHDDLENVHEVATFSMLAAIELLPTTLFRVPFTF